MFKGIMIGDAYGAGFEFTESRLKDNDGKHYLKHPLHMASDDSGNSLDAGQYTDDTQMSIAVAETLLNHDTYSALDFANSFVSCFGRDPRVGYAKGFYKFLLNQTTGQDLIDNINPSSKRNGAAMRSIPLGVLCNPKMVKEISTMQASITHNTKEGIDSSVIVALASHYLLRAIPKENLVERIENHVPGYNLHDEWIGKVECDGIMTAKAALSVLLRTDSMHETLVNAVAFGGDTDSTASIALGLQSIYQNHIDDLDKTLLDNIENSAYGFDYCQSLEHRLFEKFSLRN